MQEMPESETREMQGEDMVRLPAPPKKNTICGFGDSFCLHNHGACKCGQAIPHSNIS